MKDQKMIEMFDSIPQFDSYSKYSQTLDRVFKSSSLKGLLSELKNPKRFHPTEFLSELAKKSPVEEKVYNDNLDYNSKPLVNRVDIYSSPVKTQGNQVNNRPKILPPIKKKRVISIGDDMPDAGKYHPNYDAIYKKIRGFKIIKPNPPSPNPPQKKEKKIKVRTSKYEEEKSFSSGKRNHAIGFNQYTTRKPMIEANNIQDKITYLEPFDYLTNVSKAPDFGKMSCRTENDLLNVSSMDVPSICYYKPRYDAIEKSSPKVSFSPRGNAPVSKKVLLNRIWNSYECVPGYQLVKLEDEDNQEKKKSPPLKYKLEKTEIEKAYEKIEKQKLKSKERERSNSNVKSRGQSGRR